MADNIKKEAQEDFNKSYEFANKYITSDGFAERYKKYHPLGDLRSIRRTRLRKPKFSLSYVKPSSYEENTETITINPKEEYTLNRYGHSLYDIYNMFGTTDFPKGAIVTHELGHHIDKVLSDPANFNKVRFYPIKSLFRDYYFRHSSNYPILTPNKKVNKHDMEKGEGYADLMYFRKMLFDDGIYDSTKAKNPFTKEHLEKAKKQYRDQFIRLFNSYTDDRIIKIMNTVAQNNVKPNTRYSLENSYYG